MNILSAQSSAYLQAYSRWLKLFPKHFRTHYGKEMLRALEDQLSHAERMGDPSVVREVYFSALAELPGAATGEQLASLRQITIQKTSGFIAFTVWYVLVISGVILGGYLGYGLVLTCTILAGLSIAAAVWRYSGRFSLAILTLILSASCAGFAYLSTQQIPSYYFPQLSSVPVWSTIAFLPSYVLLAILKTNPARFSRQGLTGLNELQLEQLRIRHAKTRNVAWIGIGIILFFTIIPNAIGLYYDPYFDPKAIFPPDHLVANDQNAYFALGAITLPIDVYNPKAEINDLGYTDQAAHIGEYITGKTEWDQTDVTHLLEESAQARQKYSAASALSGYQVPSLAHFKGVYTQPGNDMAAFDFTQYRILSNLVLLDATEQFKQKQLSLGAQDLIAVLTLAKKIGESNLFYIGHLIALRYQDQAITLASSNVSLVTLSDRVALAAVLPTTQEIIDSNNLGMRWENTGLISQLPGIQGSENFQISSPYQADFPANLPYLYQPNRTARLIVTNALPVVTSNKLRCTKQEAQHSSLGFTSFLTFDGIGKAIAENVKNGYSETSSCTLDAESKALYRQLMQ